MYEVAIHRLNHELFHMFETQSPAIASSTMNQLTSKIKFQTLYTR